MSQDDRAFLRALGYPFEGGKYDEEQPALQHQQFAQRLALQHHQLILQRQQLADQRMRLQAQRETLRHQRRELLDRSPKKNHQNLSRTKRKQNIRPCFGMCGGNAAWTKLPVCARGSDS